MNQIIAGKIRDYLLVRRVIYALLTVIFFFIGCVLWGWWTALFGVVIFPFLIANLGYVILRAWSPTYERSYRVSRWLSKMLRELGRDDPFSLFEAFLLLLSVPASIILTFPTFCVLGKWREPPEEQLRKIGLTQNEIAYVMAQAELHGW